MFSKTKLVATAAVLTLTLSMGACGGGTSAGNSDANSLTIWQLTLQETQNKAWAALVAGFEEANPGVTVTTEQRASNDQNLWMVLGEVTCTWRTFPGMI